MHPYRSVLFVPGHRPDWARKAVAAGADAIVLDLEDSVPHGLKEAARGTVRRTVEEVRAGHPGIGLFVRPNALATRLAGADLEAVVCPALTGLFTPKIRTAADVVRWEALIDCFEARNGAAGLEMIVPVETVDAITNCMEIAAASPRVGAMIGPTSRHADIARAVGFRWSQEGSESLYLRSRILLACRQHGLHPLTALWEDLADLEGLRAFADYGLQLGFRGQIVIHPRTCRS
ncbi:HpcH/HpaI aldolase/citrate lyase family protein [Thermocatellispora tengchongensis]|uniref:HpcH/HpaI aldolase/citrate lyase family protein n=1 Tax=Thermocatellispora tengchongensis TaxID=1073253 RepID=UPI00362D82F0